MPAVSVIVPCFNAAETLAESLESLQRQTFIDWEAIVVDDGSTDESASIVEAFAHRDRRFRLMRREHEGVSAARNAGLQAATAELIQFFDADDLLLPEMLERTSQALRMNPTAAVAYTGWSRLAGDGTQVLHNCFLESGDLFQTLARFQPFPIHSCLARRDVLLKAGGWDPTLATCEDWDLWQRVAHMGQTFVSVPEVLVVYRMKPVSPSKDPVRNLADGLRVLDRGCSRDQRVTAEDVLPFKYYVAARCAGLALGRGLPTGALLDPLRGQPCRTLDPERVAHWLFETVLLPRCARPDAWAALWPEIDAPLTAWLDELERVSETPALARAVLNWLADLILDAAPALPLTVGRTHGIRVTEWASVEVGEKVERLRAYVPRLGRVELPVFGGRVDGAVLTDAIAAELTWPIFRERMRDTPLRVERSDAGTRVFRGAVELAAFPGHLADEVARERAIESASWLLLLQELWRRPDWDLKRFYDPGTPEAPAGTVVATDGRVTIEVTARLPLVLTDSARVDVTVTVHGDAIGVVSMPATHGSVAPEVIRTRVIFDAGFELARAFVRNHRDKPEGAVIARRHAGEIDTGNSRRASLPDSVRYAPGIIRGALEAPVVPVRTSSPHSTAQLPILMYHRVTKEPGPREYSITPDAFEEQLAMLRALGFSSATFADWQGAMAMHSPVPGRAVMLTFDDAYDDFGRTAWPLLKRYGFKATLFVTTEAAEQRSFRDVLLNESRPALGWEELKRLRDQGVEIGAHGVSHRHLTRISPTEAVRELADARALLEEKLGRVDAVAYPFGDHDAIVRHLAAACGYLYGVTTRPAHATLWEPLLALPRWNAGTMEGVKAFAAKLGLGQAGRLKQAA